MTKSILILMAWTPWVLLAQGGAASGAQMRMMGQPRWMLPRGQGGPIPGKPLSATETFQMTQVLADGTHLDNSGASQFYRDDRGRMRSGNEQATVIFDPVAGFLYMLRPEMKDRYRQQAVPADAAWCWILTMNNGSGGSFSYDQQAGPAAGPDLSKIEGAEAPVTTQLTPQNINGIWALGTRVTVNIPAKADGNNQPIQIVREQWYSTDLEVLVQSTVSDPRYGTTTYNLTQVQPGAPNPAMLQVPEGSLPLPSVPARDVKK